jgi:hypothetical protein
MTFQLSSDQVTRLALARYLLQHAETVIKHPQPLCSVALLSMHDGIEMVLDLLAEAANASIATGREFARWLLHEAPVALNVGGYAALRISTR